MCFSKRTYEDNYCENTVSEILRGKRDLLSLDFKKEEDKSVALKCIEARLDLAYKLDPSVPEQKDVLKDWLKDDYTNFLKLKKVQQQDASLLDYYLYSKFIKDNAQGSDVTITKSFSNKTTLTLSYVTKEGELVTYYDKNLGYPVKLKTEADVRIRLTAPLKLVSKIDLNISSLDLKVVTYNVRNVINNSLRQTIIKEINDRNLSYFDLSQYFASLASAVKADLETIFADYGFEVDDVYIVNIGIPSDSVKMIESQLFAIAEQKRVKDFENEMEAQSLKFYAEKAAIHNKYPEFPLGLTEAEKDFALRRYKERLGKDTAYSAELSDDKLDTRESFSVQPVKPVSSLKTNAIDKPTKSYARIALVAMSVIGFIITLSLFLASGGLAGFIALGISLLVIGTFITVAYDRIKTYDPNGKSYVQYNRELKERAQASSEIRKADREKD